MLMNFMLYMSFYMMIMSLMSTSSTLMIWLFMEMNSFMIYSFLDEQNKDKNNIYMYFIIQTITSLTILLTLSTPNNMYIEMMMMILLIISITMKLGLMPFHFWLPPLIQNLNWNSITLILTMQKIWPLLYIDECILHNFKFLINLMILYSILGSTLMIIQKNSMKWIMTFSSIYHSSWILMTWITMNEMGLMYLTMYTFNMIIFNKFMNQYNIKTSIDLTKITKSKYMKILLIWLFFNFSSFPPSPMFMMKMISTLTIINYNLMNWITPMTLICSSIVFSITYLMSINSLFYLKTKSMYMNYHDFKLTILSSMSLIFNSTMMFILYNM